MPACAAVMVWNATTPTAFCNCGSTVPTAPPAAEVVVAELHHRSQTCLGIMVLSQGWTHQAGPDDFNTLPRTHCNMKAVLLLQMRRFVGFHLESLLCQASSGMAKYSGPSWKGSNVALIYVMIFPTHTLLGYYNGVAGGLLGMPS